MHNSNLSVHSLLNFNKKMTFVCSFTIQVSDFYSRFFFMESFLFMLDTSNHSPRTFIIPFPHFIHQFIIFSCFALSFHHFFKSHIDLTHVRNFFLPSSFPFFFLHLILIAIIFYIPINPKPYITLMH